MMNEARNQDTGRLALAIGIADCPITTDLFEEEAIGCQPTEQTLAVASTREDLLTSLCSHGPGEHLDATVDHLRGQVIKSSTHWVLVHRVVETILLRQPRFDSIDETIEHPGNPDALSGQSGEALRGHRLTQGAEE